MAGVMNKTARQFNLKINKKGGRVTKIFLKPGFNVVEDAQWKLARQDPYVKALMDEDKIVDGKSVKTPAEIQEEHRAVTHEKHKTGPKAGKPAGSGGEGNGGEGGGDDDL